MYEDKTPESIKEDILDDLELADTREGSYTNELVSPVALELWKLYQSLNALEPIVFVDETSGEYIDKKAGDYGIKRKTGTKAQATINFTGTDGAVIPKGTIFVTDDGLEFETLSATTIASGTATTTISSTDVGDKYNVGPNTITQQIISISGLEAFTNGQATGGVDPESDKSLVNRLYAYLQKPATSGNAFHYEQWALEVAGVGGVKVLPLWDGPGTVKLLIVGEDKNPVDNTIVSNCSDYIEENRPIGADVTVISAEGLPINVQATVDIESSTSQATVKETLESHLKAYLESIAFEKYEIVYNRIAYMLLDIDGVIDYSVLKVNNTMDNIIIANDEVPILGTVVID